MTDRDLVKRFKTCAGCPYGAGTVRCKLMPFEKGRGWPMLTTQQSIGREPPPDWCPLRKRRVILMLTTEGA